MLLKQLLAFNPHSRITASSCLKNNLFDQIRVPGLEAAALCQVVIDPFLLSDEITKVETEKD